MLDDHALHETIAALRSARRIVAFVGAGLSAESGVKTFRDADGHYSDAMIAAFTHVETFETHAPQQLAWYQRRREQMQEVTPNPGHHGLARLARVAELTIATQNVDDLLERAAEAQDVAPAIHHLHGSLRDIRCHDCGETRSDPHADLESIGPCPACGGRLRPGVVWFGEALPEDGFAAAVEAAKRAQVCLVLGTSGLVYPAAALPEMAAQAGAKLIEINPNPSGLSAQCDLILRATTGEALPRIADALGA